MSVFQSEAQKNAFQQQNSFAFSLTGADAQRFFNMGGKAAVEQFLRAANP